DGAPPAEADLFLELSDTPDPVAVGALLTYTVAVVNSGPAQSPGAELTVTLPAGVTLVDATPQPLSRNGQELRFRLGAIAADGRAPVQIRVRPTAGGTLTLSAFIELNATDPTGENNSASEQTTVAGGGGGKGGIVATPNPLDFGEVRVGQTRSRAVTLRNDGETTVTVTVEATGGPFRVRRESFPLPAGARRKVTVQFRPRREGRYRGTLRVTTDSPQPAGVGMGVALVGRGCKANPFK
ncbi:MAG TPA: choice-of-anchor D domain-containing protein, partial [Armatimonadota bacterium]|nr:choice-of-anchor D domain-containing protein [Armatimonadota bacterium]